MLSQEIEVAKEALLKGSAHLLNLFGKSLNEIGLEYKIEDGDTPRTLIDTHSEEVILSTIRSYAEFKYDAINAEESGTTAGIERVWHIDPYDGTSNAKIKLQMSTMGIGIEKEGELFYSVILHPFERKIFWTEKGKGAFSSSLEQTALGLVEDKGSIIKISTDTSSDSAKERYAWVDSLFNQNTTIRKTEWISMMQRRGLIQNVRMTGSNLDYSTKLAEGRGHFQLTDAVGGYFDLCGGLLIEEAGGKMINLEGKNPKPGDQIAIAVANPRDLEEVLEITRLCYSNYKGFR